MATVDGSGYATNALYQAKDYDQNALATGLQSAATYDPTQQSTSTPASNVQYVQQLNSGNTSYQDTASSTQNSSSPSVAQPQSVAAAGITAGSNNTPYMSYRSNLVTAPSTTANQASVNGVATRPVAATATGATAASVGSYPVNYAGPAVVQVGSNYYTFNAATGQYQFAGSREYTFDKNYNITGMTYGNLSAAQARDAVNMSGLDGKNQMNPSQQAAAISSSSLIAGNLAAYQKDLANATAQNLADKTTGAGNTQYQATLDYLTTHGGQLSAADAQLAGMQFAGSAGASQAQQAAIAKAQAAYAAQQAQAAQLANIGIKPIDTSAVDASNQAAMSALVSQYASGNAALGGSGTATQNATALYGQNTLNHDKAAATSYNANIANYNNALATQYAADKSATGNQLYSDIQAVQQIAAQLQQEMGQLSTSQGQKAQAQLNQINNLIQQYQQAVAQYGQGSSQAMGLATGILSAGGSLGALV